jgi:amino acid permease
MHQDLVQLRTMIVVVLIMFTALLCVEPPYSIAGIVLSTLIASVMITLAVQAHRLVKQVRATDIHPR